MTSKKLIPATSPASNQKALVPSRSTNDALIFQTLGRRSTGRGQANKKVQFLSKKQYIPFPAKHDVVECPTLYWYAKADLQKLMNHEIQIALRDRNGAYPSFCCKRGIEHIVSGKAKTINMSNHCKSILQLQAQLTQSGVDVSKSLRSLSRKQSLEDRKQALKMGHEDAAVARDVGKPSMRVKKRKPRSTSALERIGLAISSRNLELV